MEKLRFCLLVLCAFLLTIPNVHAQSSSVGTVIENQAELTYFSGGSYVTRVTNTVLFSVESLRTNAEIGFHRLTDNSADARQVQISETQYSRTGTSWSEFAPYATDFPFASQVAPGNPTVATVSVAPTDSFYAGDLVLIGVSDPGQNTNRQARDQIIILVQSGQGDAIYVMLTETEINSGEFWGYVFTSEDGTSAADHLAVEARGSLSATYQDPYDPSDTARVEAAYAPAIRLFNSLTGALLDGVRVRVIDAGTGQLAEIKGLDGQSEFPAEIVTGTRIADSSGREYALGPGELVLPMLQAGAYELDIETPAGFYETSLVSDFDGLPNGPFRINQSSYSFAFDVAVQGGANFDVPFDPSTSLVVSKSSPLSEAAIGDFVPFDVEVTNQDSLSAPVTLQDMAPRGMRLIERSVTLNGQPVPRDQIDAHADHFIVSAGRAASGETVTISYVMEIIAGARNGNLVNRAFAIDSEGRAASNEAQTSIRIYEDLLRSRSTIMGQVVATNCAPDEPPRGVENVRIYLETGEYVLTDRNGKYHFQDVKPGTHVLRLDDGMLPQGTEVLRCGDDPPSVSRFVDIQGGLIWREDFQLAQSDLEEPAERAPAEAVSEREISYDEIWLSAQTPETEWVYPAVDQTPPAPAIDIGVKHAAGLRARLHLNGDSVPDSNFSGTDTSAASGAVLSQWRSVDLFDGLNEFTVSIIDKDERIIEEVTRSIWFVTEATRVEHLEDASDLLADGVTSPVLALRFSDNAGRPVHAGRMVNIEIGAPYRLKNGAYRGIGKSLADTNSIVIEDNGIAYVRLEPTLSSGVVSASVKLDNDQTRTFQAYIKPNPRPWIMVGVAETQLGTRVMGDDPTAPASDNMISDADPFSDNRIAFYSKGEIGDGWLATFAADTTRRRGEKDGDFNREVDPDASYALFGDASIQQTDAPSRLPVYAKLEKDQFQAVLGDFNTDLNQTELTRYNRTLTGVSVRQESSSTSVSAFIADANQFNKIDEIAADGTSGPYKLSGNNILVQSEIVYVETRDRLRPDQVLSRRDLNRFSDYTLDYLTGEIILTAPLDVSDLQFNPNVLVVEYETAVAEERDVSAGARAAHAFLNGKIQLGATLIHEGRNAQQQTDSNDTYGIDLKTVLSETTEFKLEVAESKSVSEQAGNISSRATFAELRHQSKILAYDISYREERPDFNQVSARSNTSGFRRIGATGSVNISSLLARPSADGKAQLLNVNSVREENLNDDQSRDTLGVEFEQRSETLRFSSGVQMATETLTGGVERRSTLLVNRVQKDLPELGLSLSASRDQTVSSNQDVSSFPDRTLFAIDKSVTKYARVSLRHERLEGDTNKGDLTTVAVTATPWQGAEIRADAESSSSPGAPGLGALFGIDQKIQLTDKWRMSLGSAHRTSFHTDEAAIDPFADAAQSPADIVSPTLGQRRATFSSAYTGVSYTGDRTSVSVRSELYESSGQKRVTTVGAIGRDVTSELSIAGAGRIEVQDQDGSDRATRSELRIGLASRPSDDGIIFLNRLDFKTEDLSQGVKNWRVVNNAAANMKITDRGQASVNVGTKYTETTINQAQYQGWTHLVGAQYRYQTSKRVDIGVSGSVLYSQNSRTAEYAFGPSVGFKPVKDVWLSVGWNVKGFKDRDFEGAEFTQAGLYVKSRIKFDERSISAFTNRMKVFR